MRVNKTLYVLCALFLGGVGFTSSMQIKLDKVYYIWSSFGHLFQQLFRLFMALSLSLLLKLIIMDIFYTQIKQAKVLNFLL